MKDVNLETCACGSTMFTETQPVEIEEGALTVYNSRSTLRYGSTSTVPVLECLVCGRLLATRTSFAGRNRLDPEVQMYARLINVITKHNDAIRQVEDWLKPPEIEGIALKEFVPDYYTKEEVNALILEVKTNGKSAGKISRTTTKKNSK